MIHPYENLGNGIILQAVRDYRWAWSKHKQHHGNKEAKLIMEDCERFFRSSWYSALTSIDGEKLIEKLKEELR